MSASWNRRRRESRRTRTQFEIGGKYYEPRATPENPVWYCVDIEFVEKLAAIITLADIRKNPALREMRILQTGNRLSVTPVTDEEYRVLMSMGKS